MASPRAYDLAVVLEHDYRQLAQDARKSEGVLGFFASSSDAPEVKEAAERAVLKVRSFSDHPVPLEQIRACKVRLPLALRCPQPRPRRLPQLLTRRSPCIFPVINRETGVGLRPWRSALAGEKPCPT